jgi:hypothetical protein
MEAAEGLWWIGSSMNSDLGRVVVSLDVDPKMMIY